VIILTDSGSQEGAEEMILWTLPALWHKPSYDYTTLQKARNMIPLKKLDMRGAEISSKLKA